jgi:hypothetical protein
MKNMVLIACALGTWDEADVYRLSEEAIYMEELQNAVDSYDEASLELLADIRAQLDELIRFRNQELSKPGSDVDGSWDEDKASRYPSSGEDNDSNKDPR